MIITTINNNKLFIQFYRLVKNGLIYIKCDNDFEASIKVKDSEFEVIELPDEVGNIHIEIKFDDKKIIKTINLNK